MWLKNRIEFSASYLPLLSLRSWLPADRVDIFVANEILSNGWFSNQISQCYQTNDWFTSSKFVQRIVSSFYLFCARQNDQRSGTLRAPMVFPQQQLCSPISQSPPKMLLLVLQVHHHQYKAKAMTALRRCKYAGRDCRWPLSTSALSYWLRGVYELVRRAGFLPPAGFDFQRIWRDPAERKICWMGDPAAQSSTIVHDRERSIRTSMSVRTRGEVVRLRELRG